MKSPFKNCKVVGADIDVDDYLRQEPSAKRGDPSFVMQRGSLMAFLECPAKWFESDGDSGGNEFGTLLDILVLTPNKFEKRFVVAPENYPVEPSKKDPRTEKPWTYQATYCKEWKAEKEKGGFTVIKADEKAEADKAVETLYKNQFAKNLLGVSQTQVMVVGEYHDPETGVIVPVKCLLDFVPSKTSLHHSDLGDLKSTQSAKPADFEWSIFNFHYDAQAFLSMTLWNEATKEQRNTWQFIVQENTPPFHVPEKHPFLSTEFLKMGELKIMTALRKYSWCVKNNNWPGYSVEQRLKFGGGYAADVWPKMVEKSPYWEAPQTDHPKEKYVSEHAS